MRRFIAVLLCWLCSSLARGSEFEEANQLYDQGKYAEAKAAYHRLVSAGTWSANLFYNLGNTSHRLGESGEAMLGYERALSLEPSHPEARANLNFLRGESGAIAWQMSWIERQFPPQWTDACTILAALAGWAAVFLIIRAVFFAGAMGSGTWICLTAAVLMGGYAAAVVWYAEAGAARAIVTAKAAEARFAPAASAGGAAVLPAGSEVRVLQERGEWSYCALPMGGRGWIPGKELARVRL